MWRNNDAEEIEIFREYLRIPSVHPNIDYEPCIEFLKRQAIDLDLDFKVFHPTSPLKPVCILTMHGANPDLKSIMLNSHMDVVPVAEDRWSHPPFAAEMKEGKIYARGSQDMKCVGTQYLAALRYFRRNKIEFKRTIHVTFVPEEEIGSFDGMKDFVKTKLFEKMNVGFGMDEGAPSTNEKFLVFVDERSTWILDFTFTGQPMHGCLLARNTAAEKMFKVFQKFQEFREKELEKHEVNNTSVLRLGEVCSVNVTMLNGGLQSNVVPHEFKMTVDCRLTSSFDHDEFEKAIRGWCDEAGEGTELVFARKEPKVEPTKADETNGFWMAFKSAMDEQHLQTLLITMPAATDARFVRSVGVPVVNFSPIYNTPILAHDHDEFMFVDVYLKGIEIYKEIIKKIANVEG